MNMDEIGQNQDGDGARAGNGDVNKVETSVPPEVVHEILDRKITFPPPCSWYQPHVAAAREDMWGYIALSALVVVKSVGPCEWPAFQLLETSSSRFTSISFCQSPWSELPVSSCPVVSGCENGIVRLWNLDNRTVAQYHDAHKGNTVVVQWSPRDSNLIYSIDTQGCLSVWDVLQSSARSIHLGKIGPTCLAVSPFEENIVAIGSKAGHVQIVDVSGHGKILVKMRHDEEVFSVSWKPKGSWSAIPSDSDFKEPFLLSSVSTLKPATIRVWDRNGKDIVLMRPADSSKEKKLLSKNFLPALWVVESETKNTDQTRLNLVSCGRLGEIISWSESCTVSDEIHCLHNNYTIFSIIQCGDILWSLSHEPVIVGWNMRCNYVEAIIPTFKGVCSIQASPVDYTKVAIGGMDATIRIIGMGPGYPEIAPSKIPTVTSRIKGKVTAVAWHPTKENRLGFGTDEGVLGIYDWKVDNKFATTFDKRVNGTVYTLDWGPSTYPEDFVHVATEKAHDSKTSEQTEKSADSNEVRNERIMLYACGGQAVHMINPNKHSNALLSVSAIISRTNLSSKGPGEKPRNRISDLCTDIKWSPDFSYLAVGYNDGRIELYSAPHLKLRCWIKCHGRGIQYLAWRPSDFTPLPKSTSIWFASASNDGTARLFNLEQLFTPDFKQNPEADVVQVISSVSTLNGHGGLRVISLAWSKHDPDLLVTVSYDRTAVVWNAKTGQKISRYTGHQHRLVTCIFHPTDAFKIITTSDELSTDFSVHIWDYRHYPYIDDQRRAKENASLQSLSDPIKIESTQDFSPAVTGAHEVGSGLKKKMLDETNTDTSKSGFTPNPTVPSEYHKVTHVPVRKDDKSRPSKKTKPKALMPITSNALINTKHTLENELRFLVDETPISSVDDAAASNGLKEGSGVENCDADSDKVVDTEMSQNHIQDPALHLGVLGSVEDCVRLMKSEKDGHASKGNWDHVMYLSHMLTLGGHENIAGVVRDAIKAGMVNETMLLIVYKHSPPLYEEALEAYVKQLIQADEHYKAAAYLLILDKIDDAVEVLVKKKLYRDAVALSKCILPPEVSSAELLEKWIDQALEEGNFELACKICCSLGKFDQGLSIIEKRNLPYAWKAGLYIAVKANDLKKAEGLGLKYLEDSMAKGDYGQCFQLVNEFNILKWMLPIILVHQILVNIARVADQEDLWTDLIAKVHDSINEAWSSGNILLDDPFYLTKIKNLLLLAIPQNIAEAQIIVSKNIALMLLEEGPMKSTLKEDCLRLTQQWIDDKNPSLGKSIAAIVTKLSS